MRMWNTSKPTTRMLALAFCVSVVLGGSLPDLGNILVYYRLPAGEDSHQFNTYFLVVGLLGLAICSIALLWRRNMGDTMVLCIKKYKWPVLCGAYLIAHCTIMSSYTVTAESTELGQWLAAFQWLVPTLLLVFLIPRVSKAVSPIAKALPITGTGLLVIAVCIILELLEVPGLWWSWSTLGLLALVVTVVYDTTKNKLGEVNSILLGASAALLGIALFETLYHTGLLFYHDFFGSGTTNYLIVIAEQLTWIIPSLIIALVLWQRYGRTIRISRITLALVLTSTICTIVWLSNGMDIPLAWYKGVGPFITNANPTMIAISRGTQGCLCLAIATCFLPAEHQRGTYKVDIVC